MELGGVDPTIVTYPNTTPAERMALVGQINWEKNHVASFESQARPVVPSPGRLEAGSSASNG